MNLPQIPPISPEIVVMTRAELLSEQKHQFNAGKEADPTELAGLRSIVFGPQAQRLRAAMSAPEGEPLADVMHDAAERLTAEPPMDEAALATLLCDELQLPSVCERNVPAVVAKIARMRAPGVPEEIVRTLEQAQDCIRGETPEDCTDEEAREHTLKRIRGALALVRAQAAAPASPKKEWMTQRERADAAPLITSADDERLMRTNLLKCYGTATTGFQVSVEHYRYLVEQVVALREYVKRNASLTPAAPASPTSDKTP
jgi:hypothetical protein